MRGLLDTHTLIWASVTPERLGAAATRVLEDRGNELYVSLVSMWEISVKVSKPQHLLALPRGWSERTDDYMSEWGLSWLPIRLNHCRAVGMLPWGRHRDPFDRMLIAQAQVEELSIITADPDFKKYDVKVVW